MRTRFLPFAITATLLLAACGPDAELVSLQNYLEEGEEIGMELSEVGTKFETLINVQANMLAWTAAEKEEMRTVTETVNALSARAQAMTVPAILESAHPLLIQSIGEMKQAIDGVAAVAEDPSKATDQLAADIEAHATKGEELADQYIAAMEAALAAEYPELLEE